MKKLAALSALNNAEFVKSGSRVMGRIGLAAKYYSPQILLGAGVVGVTTAAVLACKATLELELLVEHTKLQKKGLERKTHELTADEYSSTAYKRDLTKVYLNTGKELGKLYGIPLSLGLVSIGCIIGGQSIMHQRNVAVIAAYKGLEASFNKYRDRVIESYGEEKDQDFKSGLSTEIVKGEDGKNHKVKVLDQDDASTHVRVFDATNTNWTHSPDYNVNFVKTQETMANDRLARKGHLFLNDVLDDLGFPRTRSGAVTGWVYEGGNGDGFVDFGIKDLQGELARVMGTDEDADYILLDFNHDGIILDFLPES